jgi:DNA modification methylase
MSSSPKAILGTFSRLQPSSRWSFSTSQRPSTTAYSHSYHRYPAKFIPQLVNKAVTKYTEIGDVVCDPFGGCGTTLVEAKLLGRKSIGFDINPVAKLITDTKTRPIQPSRLIAARAQFLDAYKTFGKHNSKLRVPNYVHNERIYYWFDRRMVKRLDRIYAAVLRIQDNECRRFFLCAFSHILKNCSRWLMKSIKPTIHPDKKFPNAKSTFFIHLDSMIKKNEEFYLKLKDCKNLKTQSKMRLRDSTKRLPLEDQSVDLVITSPPYVTSYEYADLHQLTLLWFGSDRRHFRKWDKFSNQFDRFRRTFVGSSFKKNRHVKFGSTIAEAIVEEMADEDKGLSRSIARYFTDMRSAFSEMHRVLKAKSKAVIIIGNTEMHGVPILNAEVATEQLEKIGFKSVSLVKREVTNKMITPWRDKKTGKFTGKANRHKKRAYVHEYVLVVEKV